MTQSPKIWVGLLIAIVFCTHRADGVDVPAGHKGLTLPCETCHTTDSWREMKSPIRYDHSQTGFLLEDRHRNVSCERCHVKGDFVTIQSDCQTCHKDVHRAENGPDCQRCHDARGWIPTQASDLHQMTRFPLMGVHAMVDCQMCHVNQQQNEFVGLSTDCYACHATDFTSTRSPNHVAAQIDRGCEQCHGVSTPAWKPALFDHNETGFALTGAHTTTDCASCHVGGVFAGTATDCYSCHKPDFEQTKDPDHVAANFETDCQTCHTDVAWTPSTFDHNETNFALTGAHISTDCASCHVGGVFAGTATDCYSCHKPDFEQTKYPDHIAANFETDCQTCHTDVAWTPSTFDHNQTGFGLVGAHTTVDCVSCHINGVFAGTPKDCFACHQLDYERTKDPNHVLVQFSVQCLDCHTQVAWQPAQFDHNLTEFPLTGAHIATECVSCHVNGVFANTPTECFTCHESDFQTSRDPNHVTAGFPQNCESCHTTRQWDPASFNHRSYFPIYSGEHRGEWDKCADCHTQPADFKVFSCITCHEHRKSKMDSEHRGRRNYVYESQACYNCHPNGEE
ncbi:MAG: hypothetical protein ACI8V2_000266 [Candidatus Latescibacterota bacterium]|jgi:hypothetical protein